MPLQRTADIIQLIDATDLTDAPDITSMVADPQGRTTQLCQLAQTPFGSTAAVCVNPQSVSKAKACLGHRIPVATVINFPSGNHPLAVVQAEIQYALQNGADEIDLVLPYASLIRGDITAVKSFLQACQATITTAPTTPCLKIIIESGVLTPQQIQTATQLVCEIGADFVKTSTGKIPNHGASLAAIDTILSTLKAYHQQHGRIPGLKISGGVQMTNLPTFLQCVHQHMGADWITPTTLRIGASALGTHSLLQNLITHAADPLPLLTPQT